MPPLVIEFPYMDNIKESSSTTCPWWGHLDHPEGSYLIAQGCTGAEIMAKLLGPSSRPMSQCTCTYSVARTTRFRHLGHRTHCKSSVHLGTSDRVVDPRPPNFDASYHISTLLTIETHTRCADSHLHNRPFQMFDGSLSAFLRDI